MNGDDKASLIEKYQKVADLRMKLASSKADCRDYVKGILSTEQ